MRCYYNFLFILLILFSGKSFSQHPVFPQQKINEALQKASLQNASEFNQRKLNKEHESGVYNLLKYRSQLKQSFSMGYFSDKLQQAPDTEFVGDVSHDTLIITGNWTNNGPVLVFNDGVLIFQNANATIMGNMYVFQGGKVLADSSTLFFPQQYFYERSLVIADSANAQFNNCTLNHGGFSHNLVVAGSATLTMNNVFNNDWTTAGTYGNATVTINGTNLGGEYIMSDHSNLNFNNVNTLLLWHYFPDTAVINFSFPQVDTVYSYTCNNNVSGINGIGYNVQADTCYNVWWGMMPVNGSDVTISNSDLRTIGAWFQFGDTVSVSGLVDNSSYTNFVAPLPDRNLHLINCNVQTWSLYIFDTSQVHITGCIVGEVGSLGNSFVTTSSLFCDGSGGYFWASDTSVVIASGSSATTTVRSERNGIMIFGYGSVSNGTASSINNSVLIVVQSTLPQDPIPYDGSVAWFANISQPSSAYINSMVPVTGSAWIDQGPLGSWMDFSQYKLYYSQGTGAWNVINPGSSLEVRNATLATWNTAGLAPGNYNLHLVLFNDLGDSVEAVKSVNLLLVSVEEQNNSSISVSAVSLHGQTIFNFHLIKNEMIQLSIYDSHGKNIYTFPLKNYVAGDHHLIWNSQHTAAGIYYYRFDGSEKTFNGKFELREK